MKTLNNLVVLLTILTIITMLSSGFASGLMFFIVGAVIISIGRYANSFLTSKQ